MESVFQHLGLQVDWRFAFTFSGLILARIVMVTSVMPFLVGKPVPANIRMGFAVVMLVFLYPNLAPANQALFPKPPLFLMLLFMKEIFYGIAIGTASSIVFHAFEAAGGMIDNQRGAAQARLLIPQLSEQTSVFGSFNYMLGIVIFLSIGGHLFFLKALIGSYDLLPIMSLPERAPDLLAMSDEFIRMTASVLVTALQLSAPILIAILVADIILGIMSKAAPAINVWEMGFAIRGVLGVLIYFLSVGLIATQMGKLSLGMVNQVDKVIRLLSLSSP